MKENRAGLGALGEEKACACLEKLGHKVLFRNWRSGHLEIDIITIDEKGLHFVEVKSRTAPLCVQPEENVTLSKQKKIVAAAQRFLHSYGRGDTEVFFDVVSVAFDGFEVTVNYYPQAWVPTYV